MLVEPEEWFSVADLIKSLTKIKEYKVSLMTLRKTSSKFVN